MLQRFKSYLPDVVAVWLGSKQKLDLIDLTGMGKKWKEDVETLSNNTIKLYYGPEKILHPWILVCKAEVKDKMKIDVVETISNRLPTTDQPGMVIMITDEGVYDYKPYYPDPRIKYITFVDFDFKYTHRLGKSLEGFISKEWIEITDRNTYDLEKESLSGTDKNTERREENLDGMVEKSLLKFLKTIRPKSSSFRFSSMQRCSSPAHELYQLIFNSTSGEDIRFVVHHFEEMNSNTIKVCRRENMGRQVHIIVEENGIDDTLVINTQARKGIQMFLHENPADKIDVIKARQDESPVYAYLERFLTEEMKRVKINFPQAKNIRTHPWIFVCGTLNEDTYLEMKEKSKGHGSMMLSIHSCGKMPVEAKIRNVADDDNKPTIHLILENSEIDDSVYMNYCAKDELRRMSESNITDDYANDEELESQAVSSERRKPVYIKYIEDLPRKAFTNFIDRYITGIEKLISKPGEDPIEEGSLCIAVCFNLSRLQDEIAPVLQVTPPDCRNMLVVIQNCREGMSPQSMLKNNPSNKIIDFTNIVCDDGECYDCIINSEARQKVQAFIDNN